MQIRRWAAVATLCTVLAASGAAPAAQTTALDKLLDRYAGGEFDSAVSDAVGDGSNGRAAALRRDLERNAQTWIAGHHGSEDRARVVAATFAMDAAATFLELAPPVKERDRDAADRDMALRRAAADLVETGCGLLRSRKSTVSATERLWWETSVVFLLHHTKGGGEDVLYGHAPPGRTQPSHLKHAQDRITNTPELALAQALEPKNTAFVDVIFSAVQSRQSFSADDVKDAAAGEERAERMARNDLGTDLAAYRARLSAGSIEAIQLVARQLVPLEREPEISAEVRLYLGGIAMCFGGRDAARRYFSDASSSPNRDIKFLTAFLTGRANEWDGRAAEALASFQQAHNLIPTAPSATMALTLAKSAASDRTAAEGLVDDSLHTVAADDPWAQFEYRVGIDRWPELMAKLRIAIR
jgi:hypothetical protein